MAKVLVNFQDEFLQEIDKIAEHEHRTRSSLIREALRRYLSQSQAKIELQQKENTNTTSSANTIAI
jgi:metal-responsive CopG/Arc/MetJ family transcriptional regulator